MPKFARAQQAREPEDGAVEWHGFAVEPSFLALQRAADQADTLIEIASDEGVQLYHAPDDTAFADVEVDGHRETWPVRSAGFARWLRRAFFARTERGPNSTAMATAIGMIEARAHYERPERPVHLRVATEGDRIYLDLCDPNWRAVEIDADGWRIEDAPPVRFRRAKGMLPLPAPVPGGSIEELREHLHVSCSHLVLVVSWRLPPYADVAPTRPCR